MSAFGAWTTARRLAPRSTTRPTTGRTPRPSGPASSSGARRSGSRRGGHWALVGNRRVRLYVANDGGLALSDEAHGLRWLTAPDGGGTGVLRRRGGRGGAVGDGRRAVAARPRGGRPAPPRSARSGRPGSRSAPNATGVSIERTVRCPEGEAPWVLVRVRLAAGDRPRRLRHVEEWAVRTRFLNVGGLPFARGRARAPRRALAGRAGRARAPSARGADGPARLPPGPALGRPASQARSCPRRSAPT